MKAKTLAIAFAVIGAIGVSGYGAYRLGMDRGMKMGDASSGAGAFASGAPQKPGDIDPATGKKILYWHDPMVPGQKFDKPGKSPFMDMQLVPVYEDAGGQGGVTIDPRMQQSLGVRVAEVRKGALSPTVEAVGNVAYNERETAVVQARSNGFVERLHVRAPLDSVRKGQALADLYVPDWVAAQEEYLSVRRMSGTRLDALVDGARQRMRLAGMSEEQIRMVESTGKVHPRLTVTAPIGGVIAELGAREGMTVMSGAMLFRINGLGIVWVNAEVRENQASEVLLGNEVEARTPALPEKVFKGKVSAILPEVNATTRTLKARVELANPRAELKPGMFITVNFTPAARKEALLVPTESVIQTGKRTVVIVAQGEGKFAPVEVEIGVEAGGETEIRKGLEAGQKVVFSGQFLIDSEASLRGTITRMRGPQAEPPTAAVAATHKGVGKVEAIGKDEVTLSHEPIASLQWPAMTMGFKAPPNVMPQDLKVGDAVTFELRKRADGSYEITAIAKAAKR
ncbi:MAG: efflux transporter periplasmic adaptor subunit [Betaproteobacteria bacterium 13_1_40CM_4_64_4]|nr:MAG: efflux transporter periplasmic adaptor subunit [Betaproteobacteria bacterium 13_1_40CM_4_64_4]